VLKDFTKATGIQVVYDTYVAKEAADARLTAGASGADVVVLAAEPYLETEIAAGLYRKLDPAKAPSLALQDAALLKVLQAADPTHEYVAIYLWGSVGLAYNVDEVKKRVPDAPRNSYALLFNPKYAKKLSGCGIALIDDPAVILPMALQYLGIDPNAATLEDYRKAADVVAKIRPTVRHIDSNALVADLAAKKICLATEWNGDAVQAIHQAASGNTGAVIDYVVPKEGGLMFIDALAIPKDAPHPEAAHAFIDYLLSPKEIAQSTDELGYANAVPAGAIFLDRAVAGDNRIFPPEEVKARLVLVKALAPELREPVAQLWSKLKGGP
jgi:putrescine transport system substrate-binding protein